MSIKNLHRNSEIKATNNHSLSELWLTKIVSTVAFSERKKNYEPSLCYLFLWI